ncbi:7090_t:CDS:2 [Funneliformis caledonium]|uniref:7090_t:CDS:1 n=1 Tax=Funneliformis caledonium TaxID=1117310 RepID=A0A9N9DYG5_9GLOM|nr:7090_t:CDS:2 [Funneliformis caledonium]
MEVDWDFFLNFPDGTILPTNFFAENNESNTLKDIITPPKSPVHFFELEEIPIELPSQSPNNFNDITYQYNFCVGDSFDDWISAMSIVYQDVTFSANKYNMYLSVFMIKDNYGKFRNVVNALVEDELFNAGIQSTQSVKSFNAIIKKVLNNANSLCDIGKLLIKDMRLNFSIQKFQISQSFTYEGHLISTLNENLDIETASSNFIDESQITLTSLLSVVLLSDGTHLSLYLSDGILTNLDTNLKNSLILTAVEASTDTSYQVICKFQSLYHIQGSDHNEVIQQNTHNTHQ